MREILCVFRHTINLHRYLSSNRALFSHRSRCMQDPAPLPTDGPRSGEPLSQLALLAGLAAPQFFQSCAQRRSDALRQPAAAGQRIDAAHLAKLLEASLPDHAGTALRTRAALCILLLDPPGADRLALALNFARQILTF